MMNVSLTVLIMACSVLVFVVSPEKCAPWDAGRASPNIYSSLMATSTSMNCTVCQFLRAHTEINDNTFLNGLSSLWFVKCVKLSSQKSKKNSVSVLFPRMLCRFVSYCMVALKTLCTASSRSSGETWASRSSNIFNCFLYSTNMASSSPWG